jgi:O-antigen ligase
VRQLVSFGLLILSVGYAVVAHGGIQPAERSFSLVLVGLAAIVSPSLPFPRLTSGHPARLALATAAFFPLYVTFQILPLPVFVVRAASPTRAEIAGALGSISTAVGWAPLSIIPTRSADYLFQVAACVLAFLLVRQVLLRTQDRIWASALPLIVIGVVEAALGLIWRPSEGPISGTYFNKNHFAGLLEMILPLALMYAVAIVWRQSQRRSRFLGSAAVAMSLLATAVLMFVAIGLSLSKAGFASTIGALTVMALAAIAVQVPRARRWALGAVAIVVAALAFLYLSPEALVQQFGGMAADETGEGRVPMALDSLHLIGAFPVFGSGLGTYYPALLRYQTSALDFAVTNAHNDYLQLCAELGLVGSLALATFLGALLWHAWRVVANSQHREARLIALACLGSLAALLLHSLADFNLYVPANAMVASWISGIACGLPVSMPGRQATVSVERPVFLRAWTLILGCLTIAYATIAATYFYRYQEDPRAEHAFCHLGVCDTYSALSALRAAHGGESSAVPPADLMDFLRRDPANPSRWEDLGDSFQRAGDIDRARRCFERAVTLGPRIPSTLFDAGRFHLGLNEQEVGLDLMSRAVAASQGLSDQVFKEYERFGVATSEVVLHGLPDDAAVWRAYLRRQFKREVESSSDGGAAAATVWEAIGHHGYVDSRLASDYIDFVLRVHGPAAAALTWGRYAGQAPEAQGVFNGDFEADPTGVLFDWRIEPARGVAIDFDRSAPYSGKRSLRVRFDGTANVREVGLQQQVYLRPGRYRISAQIRAKELSTDQGVFLRVAMVPPSSAKGLDVSTDPVRGSKDWTLIEGVFEGPPGGGLVRVTLARKPSLKFDNLLKGTVWVDEVSIRSDVNPGDR